MSATKQPLQISPVSAWLDGDLVELPSKRVMRLRQLDVLSIIGDDGNVPNFLIPLLSGAKGTAEPTAAEVIQLAPLLNKVAMQCVVEPAIVGTEEAVAAGEGIMLYMIPMQDKMAMLSHSMGGMAAVTAAQRFQQKQDQPVAAVSDKKDRITEFTTTD